MTVEMKRCPFCYLHSPHPEKRRGKWFLICGCGEQWGPYDSLEYAVRKYNQGNPFPDFTKQEMCVVFGDEDGKNGG